MRRARTLLSPLIPIVLCLATLWAMEAGRAEGNVHVAPLADEPAATRLVVFWIDSWAARDVSRPTATPQLAVRLGTALHGPVRACADAVSVACFTAMTTGRDRFSLFSLVRNFANTGSVPQGSLFHALQARGKRIGYLGDPIFTTSVFGFDWRVIEHEMDDLSYIERGIAALDEQHLDVVVIHLRESDKLSHLHGPQSEAYLASLRRVDDGIAAARTRLRPSDHIVVLGDHGHDAEGRHFAGLNVPTYAAYWGPRIERPLKRSMAITDHAAIWARIFGLDFGDVPWVEAYFRGAVVPAAAELPEAHGGAPLPWSAAMALMVLVVPIAMPARSLWPARRRGGIIALAAAVAATALAAGWAWTGVRPLLNWNPRWLDLSLPLAVGGAGAVVLSPWLRRWWPRRSNAAPLERALVMLLAATVLLALPTIYKYGGSAAALTALLVTWSGLSVRALRAGEVRAAAALAVAGAGLATVWNPAVRNFAVRWFPVYAESPLALSLGVAVAATAAAVIAARGRSDTRSWLLAGGVGATWAAALPGLPAWAFVAPCTASVPLAMAAGRWPRLGPWALLAALPALAFFYEGDVRRLAPLAVVLAAWALWSSARRGASPLERGTTTLVLIVAALWVGFGGRAAGVDFQYFFAWLPADADVKDTWVLNGLLTTGKYVLPPLLGLTLAARAGVAAASTDLPVAWALARVKAGLVVLFALGFSTHGAGAGPFVTADVIQEAGLWVLIAVIIALAARPEVLHRPEAAVLD